MASPRSGAAGSSARGTSSRSRAWRTCASRRTRSTWNVVCQAGGMTRAPYLSARLQGFGTTIFAEMSALAVATGAINLGQGFPDYPGPPEVLDVARAAIGTPHDQYPPGPGIPVLREAIAEHGKRFGGHGYDPADEVLVTAGATEALTAALLALLEPGDEVVLFEPMYDSYAAAIAMAGGVTRPVPLLPPASASGPWTFDHAELRAAV